MATYAKKSRIRCCTGNATATEVKANKLILPGFSGAYIIVGGWLRALGGNAATATTVNISSTAGTPVVGVACTCTDGLAENRICTLDDPTYATCTTFGDNFVAGDGLMICDAGGALAGATSVDYCIEYMKVSG